MSAVDAEITNSNKKQSSTSPTKDTPEKQNGAATTNITSTPKGNKETTNETAKNGHNKQQSPHGNAGKSMNVLRERSFIRPTNPQMMHPINAAIFMADPMHHQKRRSFGQQQVVSPFGMGPPHHHHQLQNSISASAIHHHHQQQHLRGKPELEVYRPPSTSISIFVVENGTGWLILGLSLITYFRCSHGWNGSRGTSEQAECPRARVYNGFVGTRSLWN